MASAGTSSINGAGDAPEAAEAPGVPGGTGSACEVVESATTAPHEAIAATAAHTLRRLMRRRPSQWPVFGRNYRGTEPLSQPSASPQ